MNNKAKELPMIIKVPVYIAGIAFGIFVTKSILNNTPEQNEKPIVDTRKESSPVSMRVNKSALKMALEIHYMHYGEYPEKLIQLVPDRFRSEPLSTCGEPYVYSRASDGRGYTINAEGC